MGAINDNDVMIVYHGRLLRQECVDWDDMERHCVDPATGEVQIIDMFNDDVRVAGPEDLAAAKQN